jgi:NtrC-family two-component system sensor histidine kinase KinB
MNRWSFISGLTVTLLLLLMLSGFCVWATRGLTGDISSIINQNYDNIRSIRELRSAMTRLNAQVLVLSDIASLPTATKMFRQEREVAEKRIHQLERNATAAEDRELVARLTALGQGYFAAYDELFALKRQSEQRHLELSHVIIGLTGDISNVADEMVILNERFLIARRDVAVQKGRRVTVIALGFAIFSLGIYVLTSMRLTRAIYEPLRRLRDAIQLVSARRFDTLVPIEGGEEIAQIASGFNEMARELQRYISETDERAVTASRMSRAILEALPYPVYIVDQTFSVRQTNPRAEVLSQALGIPGSMPGEVRRQIDEAAAQNKDMLGDDIRRAVRLSPADTGASSSLGGDYLPLIFRMIGVFGEEDGWAVLLVDVTRLRRNDEAKTKALATLSHEVKTPVSGIRMTLHLLLEGKLGAINADQRELLEVSRDDCERLLAVLQALLELARLESGHIELRPEPYAPADLLSEVMSAHGEGVRRRGGELVLDAPQTLPAVLADPLHASRVLANFLSNAAKYGLPGKPVVLRAQVRGDGYVRFSIINHGRPLSEADQAKVFDPFFRRPGEVAEGTGLGLSICREIATLHGGRVGVYSPVDSDLVEFFFDLRRAG